MFYYSRTILLSQSIAKVNSFQEVLTSENNHPLADIVSPPLSIVEEDGEDIERRITPPESSYKDKGVRQSELFDTQKLMNGVRPNPTRVKRYAQSWRHYLRK